MNDGSFPSVNNDEGFFNDSDREKLKSVNMEIARTTIENLYMDNFNIYKAFTTTEEKLYISYISSDSEGAGQKPSTILLKLKKIFPELVEESDIIKKQIQFSTKAAMFDELLLNIRNFKDGKTIDETWFEIFKIFENDKMWSDKLNNAIKGLEFSNIPDNINKENVKRLYGDVLKTSVSKLESFQKCPFSFYLKYGLKLKDKETFKLESLDTGSFMHDVIDCFFGEIENQRIEIVRN